MQCALCRQGWQPAFDAELEALCAQLGIDWHALQQSAPATGVTSVAAAVPFVAAASDAVGPAVVPRGAFAAPAPPEPVARLPEQAVGAHPWTDVGPPPAARCPQSTAGSSCHSLLVEVFWFKVPRTYGQPIPFSLWVGRRPCRSRRSPPVPLSRFLSALETLQDVAALDGRRAAAFLPFHALVHFRWVLEQCLSPNRYVPASAQEALLQIFLGERAATDMSVLADRLRAGARPAPPADNPVFTRVPKQQPATPGCSPAAVVAPAPASSRCLPVGLPGPPSSPSAAPLPGHPADPLGLPEDPVALLGPAPEPLPAARPGLPDASGSSNVPLAQPPPAGEPGLPGPPSSPSAAPLAGDPANPMPDADSAAPLSLPRMPELESPPVRAALARLDQLDLPRVLQQRCLFSKAPQSSSAALSGRPCLLPCGPSTPRPSRLEHGCYCPVCFSTDAPALTGLPSPSGVPGFWISKPADGRHCSSPPPRAFQLQPTPPPAAPADPARRAERAAQLVGQASFQLRVLHWFLDPWPRPHLPPWPSYRTRPEARPAV